MWRRVLGKALVAAGLVGMAWGGEMLQAPLMDVRPVDQLAVAGNACGPAALLNAFQSGNKDWRRAWDGVTGSSDREKILLIIRNYGMRESRHASGQKRWSRRGVNLVDLKDIGDEMVAGRYLPQLSEEVFFRGAKESPEKLLERVHRSFAKSLGKGLPPVLSIRRQAWRAEKGHEATWVTVDAHFVTLTSLPRKLGRGDRSFAVTYIDPWGGRRLDGRIQLPEEAIFGDAEGRTSCLEAVFPKSSVGSKMLKPGEKSVLIVAAGIGRW